MDDTEQIDGAAVLDWCRRRIEGFPVHAGLTKFATGQSNPTWRIDGGGRSFVLRAKPPGRLLKSAHQVEREFRVMQALAGTPVPVPKVLALAEDAESPIGRAFFVMEYLDGRIFWDPALPGLTPGERADVYAAMARVLADLHAVRPEAIGLADFGRPGNYFARQTDRWTRQYLASAPDPDPGVRAIINWLTPRIPVDDGQVSIVHGDYRMDNMIFAPGGASVLGLLDWELSTLGHPLADLAYQCMQWRLPAGSAMRGLGGLDRAALGIPTESEYVAAYCAHRGIGAILDWSFPLVFSFFRLIAILEGVVRRAADGNASNPELAARFASVIPELTRLALAEIGAAGSTP